MQTITRHGGGSHWVRPDRVYRTGVLQSAMGYDPGADVQDVAASFTQYPMDLQAPTDSASLSGLGAFGAGLSLFQRMKLRYEAWRARQHAAAAIKRGSRMGRLQGWHYGVGGLGDARQNGVAYPQVGMELSPAEVNKRDMAELLMNGGIPEGLARAQAGSSWNYWINQRWNR